MAADICNRIRSPQTYAVPNVIVESSDMYNALDEDPYGPQAHTFRISLQWPQTHATEPVVLRPMRVPNMIVESPDTYNNLPSCSTLRLICNVERIPVAATSGAAAVAAETQ
jgi:hypothetical protein